jgi:hypothetical protein
VTSEKILTVFFTILFVVTSFIRDTASKQKLTEIVTAIAPRSLSDEDQKDITDACRPFARPNIKVVVVTSSGYGTSLGIQIWNALKNAGFMVELQPTGRMWYEVSISGPLEESEALTAISTAVGKKLPIMGVLGISQPGSPITITVGERLIGKLPSPSD